MDSPCDGAGRSGLVLSNMPQVFSLLLLHGKRAHCVQRLDNGADHFPQWKSGLQTGTKIWLTAVGGLGDKMWLRHDIRKDSLGMYCWQCRRTVNPIFAEVGKGHRATFFPRRRVKVPGTSVWTYVRNGKKK